MFFCLRLVCVCVCVCTRARACVCVYMHVRVSVRACVWLLPTVASKVAGQQHTIAEESVPTPRPTYPNKLLFLNLPLLLAGGYHIPWVPILILVFAPTFSGLIQLALSRTREYEADRGAVALTGDPEALISALLKMEQQTSHLLEQLLLPGQRIPEPSLLRTHPRTEDRIRRLRALESQPGPDFHGLSPDRPGQTRPALPRWHRTGIWY